MEKDKLEPKLRFPGFTEPWEQRKLNEVISRFIVPMRDKPKSFDGNIPWTRIEDIEGNEISRSLTNQNVSEETVEKMNLRIIPKDSLIVSASATFGVTAFVKANLITNQTFIGLVPNDNIDLGFLYYSFNAPSLRTQMKMESAGSTIFYIPQDRFKEMVISLPNIKEQYKLAKLFSDLDKLITLHQRKEEELQKLKKGLLQKMFPKDGESVPEIRFPNFTDSWEHRKFGELFTFLQNNTLSRADLYPKGIAYNVHYGDVLIKYGEVIDLDVDQAEMIADDVIVKKYLKSKLQNGDLIFADTAEDETVGKTSEIQNIGNRTVISGLHTIPLRPKTEFAFGFLGFLFSSVNFRNELKPLIQGIKVSSISKNALKTLTVKISADVKEQAEISNLLLHLSHAITLHHRKTEELKKLKKALLQQMFV